MQIFKYNQFYGYDLSVLLALSAVSVQYIQRKYKKYQKSLLNF